MSPQEVYVGKGPEMLLRLLTQQQEIRRGGKDELA